MTAIQRISVATIEVLAFFIICCTLSGSFEFIRDTSSPFNLLFLSSAVSIILGKYISEPFFTTPLGAISNSIAAFLILLAVNNPDNLLFYWPMMALFIVILACSVGVLLLNIIDRVPRIKRCLLSISSALGKSKVLYSFIYLSGVLSYLRSDPDAFAVMIVAWAIVVCTPFFEAIVRIPFSFAKKNQHGSLKGSIVDSIPGKYYVASFPSVDKTLEASSSLLLLKQGRKNWIACYVSKIEILPFETIASGICIPEILIKNSAINDESIRAIAGDDPFDALLINKNDIENSSLNALEENPVFLSAHQIIGFVDEQSDIETIRIRVLKTESDDLYQVIHEGTVVESSIRNERVLYQIINGVDRENQCKAIALSPFVHAYAKKLGSYDATRNIINNVKWLPELGSPVYARNDGEDDMPELAIGKLPGTSCSICLKDINALITHNTAILGILGVGKSCLSFELIQKITQAEATQNTKIICLDLTNEYSNALKQYGVSVCDPDDEAIISAIQQDYRKATKSKDEGGNSEAFRKEMRSTIETFMGGSRDSRVLVINPEKYEVSKQTTDGKSSNYGKPPFDLTPFADLTPAEITRIISEEALDHCKSSFTGKAEGAKLLLVFEEAHSLVPEWSSAANDGDRNAANGTARVILQGRKYGLGSMIITQRTANVSKSILNQCNTIFALRVFDDTGKQFLENYVGSDYAAMLPALEERHAIAAGKALKLTCPVEIELNDRESLVRSSFYNRSDAETEHQMSASLAETI
ncbi:ATP-binding protein [Enorma massiliensis]|uniref:ATP-binding protein n=1 Tax=Enorma massiliensis TaxID=1472761 RepID=UPI001957C0C0|nr:DUF87 domain-containing protein [Enorma massiliensis]MBM6892621.1 ATP-binding protein [Enorma massiliensis]